MTPRSGSGISAPPLPVPKILEKLGFTNYVSDQVYVSLAGVLMVFALVYAWYILLQRRKPALPDFRRQSKPLYPDAKSRPYSPESFTKGLPPTGYRY